MLYYETKESPVSCYIIGSTYSKSAYVYIEAVFLNFFMEVANRSNSDDNICKALKIGIYVYACIVILNISRSCNHEIEQIVSESVVFRVTDVYYSFSTFLMPDVSAILNSFDIIQDCLREMIYGLYMLHL